MGLYNMPIDASDFEKWLHCDCANAFRKVLAEREIKFIEELIRDPSEENSQKVKALRWVTKTFEGLATETKC